MVVEDVFEKIIYPNLKTYVETYSPYTPKVTKTRTLESKIFPIVPVKLLPVTNRYNNLNYGEETYTFGIEIDIYGIDMTIDDVRVSKRTICDEIMKSIVEYIKSTYHFTIKTTEDAPNVDDDVFRNNIRLTGTLDTKYGNNNLVIYPFSY